MHVIHDGNSPVQNWRLDTSCGTRDRGSERKSEPGISLEMSVGLSNRINKSYLLFVKFSLEAYTHLYLD